MTISAKEVESVLEDLGCISEEDEGLEIKSVTLQEILRKHHHSSNQTHTFLR
jgi:hypothetical protein